MTARVRPGRRSRSSSGLSGGYLLARSRRRGRRSDGRRTYTGSSCPSPGTEISRRAVDAALRLARAEDATLMPAYLAEVPKSLPLECAIPAEAAKAMPMLEAIEQRAAAQEVPVDARIERGRSYRHALARLLEREEFDRVVVPATATGAHGLLRRRPRLAAGEGSRRGADPAPGSRRRAPGHSNAWALIRASR